MKNLIKQYDTPATIVVLTSFPTKKNRNGKMSAIDRYSEKKLTEIAKTNKVIVCAEEENSSESMYEHKKNILVVRCWEKGRPFSFIETAKFILSLQEARRVLVEFEFNVYGGTVQNVALLGLLTTLRSFKRKVVFELHQVITDIGALRVHLNINNIFLQGFYSFGIKMFYRVLGKSVDSVIVTEEELKKRLSSFVPTYRIATLPHFLEKKTEVSNALVKKELGIEKDELVVLVFGFLNWYKGVDWIVRTSKKWKNKKIRLVVAGGPNPYHIEKKYYKIYIKKLLDEMKTNTNIIFTDYVPDNEIKKYFSIADLVAFPYRVFMSASGPFSIAVSYGKPVLLSENLNSYMSSNDISLAMKKNNLQKEDLFFSLEDNTFLSRLYKIQKNKEYRAKLANFSEDLAQLRSNTRIIAQLKNLIFFGTTKTAVGIYDRNFLLQS